MVMIQAKEIKDNSFKVYDTTDNIQYLRHNMGTVLTRTIDQIGRQSRLFNTFSDILLPLAVHEYQYVHILYLTHI